MRKEGKRGLRSRKRCARESRRVRGGLEKAAEEVAVEKEITRGRSAPSHTDQ